MIEIKHRQTGQTLVQVAADTLYDVDLPWMNLEYADLSGANLGHANLHGAVLVGADLRGANLSRAVCTSTNMENAKLEGANLREALLESANLSETYLRGADLSGAWLGHTQFMWCKDLPEAIGLTVVNHRGPSELGVSTLRDYINELPEVFLRGVGYTTDEISHYRALYGGALRYYSCFISYARLNGEFAERLYRDLQANNVSCFMDVFDMRGGDYFRTQIDDQIRLRDKVVLVCSEDALLRDAVVEEIITGLETQQKTGVKKLFPIRIDDHIFSNEVATESRRRHQEGDWRMDWVNKIRAFHIPDFRGWKDHDTYQRALNGLLRDLQASASTRSA